MKRFPLLVAASIALLPWLSEAAQTAQARIHSLSVKVQKATEQFHLYSEQFTTINGVPNGELRPNFFNDPPFNAYTHASYLSFRDESFALDYEGRIALDLPTASDANNNGLPDFFEVARPVSATTSGVFEVPALSFQGSVTAQWSRVASNSVGTCLLTLHSTLQDYVFNHPFQILEYKGPLSYTPGATNVAGTVNLTQTAPSGNTLAGPVQFTKIFTNKYNLLTLQPTFWTNANAQTLSVDGGQFYSRDLTRRTNYSGYLAFEDGDPSTADDDYFYWWFTVSDLNDTDHDQIPDFSDDPPNAPPRRPSLSLTSTATNVLLTISGDLGHLHQVQEATVINPASWPTVLSVTLTNDPQTVALPKPATGAKFWRVQAQ